MEKRKREIELREEILGETREACETQKASKETIHSSKNNCLSLSYKFRFIEINEEEFTVKRCIVEVIFADEQFSGFGSFTFSFLLTSP